MRIDIEAKIALIQSGKIPNGYKEAHGYIIPAKWSICKFRHRFTRLNRKNAENNQNVLTISAQQGLICQSDYYNHSYASEDKTGYQLLYRGDYCYNKSYSSKYAFGAIKRLDRFERGIVSPLYICFESNSGTISDYYLHYFEAGIFNKEIYKIAQEGARNHGLLNVSLDEFFNSNLLCPTNREQKKIAEILNHCDKIISLKQQLIKQEQNRKKWLIQNLLNPNSGVRLQGFSGEWKKIPLSKVGIFYKGTGISNDQCKTGSVPCVKYGDIYMSYNEFFVHPVSLTESAIAKISPKAKKNALLFTVSGEDRLEIGKATAYLGDLPLAVGGDIVVLQPNSEKFNAMFLAYQQYSDSLIKQKSQLAQGYSIVHLYTEQIKRLIIVVPSCIEEQEAIANTIVAQDYKISLYEKELAQWQRKKKALMQLLLTGLVRVNV